MAKFVATDVKTTINGVDFYSHIAAVTWEITADEIETTAFGGSGYRTRVAGLKDGSITIDFHQDFATTTGAGVAAVDQTIWGLFGSVATVVSVPTSGSVSASTRLILACSLCLRLNLLQAMLATLPRRA